MSAYCHRLRGAAKPGIAILGRFCWLLALSLPGVIVPSRTLSAQSAQKTTVVAKGPATFDLQAQALESAIEAFSVSSGWQVVYDASFATDRRSAAVKGHMPPATALNQLLAGTGLTIDFMTADAAMLVPIAAVRHERVQQHAAGYYGHVQATLKRAICASEQPRLQAQRIAIGFWIGTSAVVTRVELLGTTGDTAIDASFRGLVQRLSFEQAPPAGFKQPVVVLITPDLLAQCGEVVAQPVGAGR